MFALLFSTAMSSSPVRAEWTWVSENDVGAIFYVDFERIRKHDGYVYYWELVNLSKPFKDGTLSVKSYIQTDCKLFGYKNLSNSFHKEPMGDGTAETDNTPDIWKYPPPNSSAETILKKICSQ